MLLSKRDPSKDPIILWLQGGPGASSMYGLMIQWGSKVITCGADQLIDNPFPLNERATVIFLDNPAGVGFSSPEGVDDSFSSALDILNFLDQLRKTNFNGHKFADQPLHIMGASYAGHYISALGLTIATAPKYKSLNVRSLIMANPSLDERRQYGQVYDTICDSEKSPNAYWMLDNQQCLDWKAAIPQCQLAIDACRKDLAFCGQGAIETACEQCTPWLYFQMKSKDPYDLTMSRPYGDGEPFAPRAENLLWVRDFLNTLPNKGSIGAMGEWKMFQPGVRTLYRNSGDVYRDASVDISKLLSLDNLDMKILMYAGENDLMCPYLGLKRIVRELKWPGAEQVNNLMNRPEIGYDRLQTKADKKVYGNTIEVGPLKYARIFGAGHMAQEKKGAEVREMVYDFIGVL